jgi:hypothetical protein
MAIAAANGIAIRLSFALGWFMEGAGVLPEGAASLGRTQAAL